MKKYIILIPIYNDRESLTKLIENINLEVKSINSEISILIINDASSEKIIENYQNIENIYSIEIINMRENKGSIRCIASGLKYIFEKKEFDYVIPMDGDGEDRPEEIFGFINEAQKLNNKAIVGNRIKRSEDLFFNLVKQNDSSGDRADLDLRTHRHQDRTQVVIRHQKEHETEATSHQ